MVLDRGSGWPDERVSFQSDRTGSGSRGHQGQGPDTKAAAPQGFRPPVRQAAAGALQEIGDPKAIAPLRARLNGFLGIFGGERNSDVLDQIKRAIKTLE